MTYEFVTRNYGVRWSGRFTDDDVERLKREAKQEAFISHLGDLAALVRACPPTWEITFIQTKHRDVSTDFATYPEYQWLTEIRYNGWEP